MAISKKIRFSVFKRDGFTCGYCGKTPPAVVLEVDHIIPKAEGGKDGLDNLITACFDCNRGKGSDKLTVSPDTLAKKTEVIKEKQKQIKEFEKLLKLEKKILEEKCETISSIYNSYFPGWVLNEKFMRVSLAHFLKALPISDVEDAMYSACSKVRNKDRSLLYFCGICWKKIREATNEAD